MTTTLTRICIFNAALGLNLAISPFALAQQGTTKAKMPAAAPAGNSQRQGGTPVRPVSGPTTPPTQAYGPQPAGPIKEPGAPANTNKSTPVPLGPVVGPGSGQGNPPRNPMGGNLPGAHPANGGPLKQTLAPEWYPLPPEEQKYLDDILAFWEQESQKIERYQCKFTSQEFDPVFGPQPTADGQRPPKIVAEGMIKYKKPDKGCFEVTKTKLYTAPKTATAKPTWPEQPAELNEHWVCDGTSVFEFNGQKKQLIERPLPVEMQGKGIAEGPLPFLFGAKAATIKARYWIHVITPKGVKGEYHLEAVPKTIEDAKNFKKVVIIIDEKDYLPKTLKTFEPNYDARTNPAMKTYQFEDRRINMDETFIKLVPWMKSFDKPTTPFGWKKIVEAPDLVQPRPTEPPPAQAKRPLPGKNLK